MFNRCDFPPRKLKPTGVQLGDADGFTVGLTVGFTVGFGCGVEVTLVMTTSARRADAADPFDAGTRAPLVVKVAVTPMELR